MRGHRIRFFISAFAAFELTSRIAFGAVPAFYPLNAGDTVNAINDAGQGAGYYRPATNDTAALFDGAAYTGAAIHGLEPTAVFPTSFAGAINGSGQIAGFDYPSGFGSSRAFRYDGVPGAGGVKRILGTFGGPFTFGIGINDGGQVTGPSDHPVSDLTISTEAYVYTGTPGVDGVMQGLGTLGGMYSEGDSINNAGQVSGYSSLADNVTTHAFRYDGSPGSGVMRDLGGAGSFTNSFGLSINDHGQVAGFMATDDFTAAHGFVYIGTPGIDGTMIDLLPVNGGVNSFASSINNTGYALGQSDDGGGIGRLILWRPDGSPIDLDAWFDLVRPDLGPQWVLSLSTDINNAGLIAGIGDFTNPDTGITSQASFVLDASSLVPEPGSVAMVCVCLCSLRRRLRATWI